MYKKAFSTKEIESEINKIKLHINELEQEQQILTCKISGLKTAAGYIDSLDENKENNELGKTTAYIQKITEKGLGILEAQEVERQRIARDLHDTTVQNLTSLVHKSELCIKLIDIDSIRAKLELNIMSNTLKMIINDMRGIIYNLKPMTLDDLGLTITIQRYANKITNLNNIHVKVTANDEPNDILPVFKLTIFRIIQEACNNIIKHANASFINLDLNYEENKINVKIKDNGMGFDINKFKCSDRASSFGLSIMKERISLLSGSLEIKSECGKGTLINVTIPISINEGGDK
jgi:two-component system sensor histidine kinase DegS